MSAQSVIRKKTSTVYIPIETLSRELDYKLLLGILLTQLGFTVKLGEQSLIEKLIYFKRNATYFGKGIQKRHSFSRNLDIYDILKRNNFRIVYMHEEGGIYAGNRDNWKNIVKSLYKLEHFDQDDIVLTWGKLQKESLEDTSDNCPIIYSVGTPRLELAKPQNRYIFSEEAKSLEQKYGSYFLINANYSLANHGIGITYAFDQIKKMSKGDKNTINKYAKAFLYNTRQMTDIVEATLYLSEQFPDHSIIFRPHPSEDQSTYKNLFSGRNNIYVINEGNVIEWIVGSKCVIHDGCTTAIEAFFANRKVINYKRTEQTDLDILIPNTVGTRAHDLETLLRQITTSQTEYREQNSIYSYRDVLENLVSDSFKNIIDVFSSHKFPASTKSFFPGVLVDRILELTFILVRGAKTFTLNRRTAYASAKFSAIDNQKVTKRIELIKNRKQISLTYKIRKRVIELYPGS